MPFLSTMTAGLFGKNHQTTSLTTHEVRNALSVDTLVNRLAERPAIIEKWVSEENDMQNTASSTTSLLVRNPITSIIVMGTHSTTDSTTSELQATQRTKPMPKCDMITPQELKESVGTKQKESGEQPLHTMEGLNILAYLTAMTKPNV